MTMERLRNKLDRLSAKWPVSRPTAPVPEVRRALESESGASEQPHIESTTVHISERLWNQAYDHLRRESSTTIVVTYRKILFRYLQTDLSLEDNIIGSDHAIRREQMKRLTSKGLENIAKDSSRKQRVNQWLELSKPLREAVGAGLKAVPQAAVPWAGICCALEVSSESYQGWEPSNRIQILSSLLTEPTKNREVMECVLKRMDWSWELSPWLLQDAHASDSSRPMRGQLEKHIVTLYQNLLLLQMKSVILYHRSRLAVFMRDFPKVDDWAGHVKDIKEAEKALGVDSNQCNTLEMRTNLQELSFKAKEHAQWQRMDRLDVLDNEYLAELRVTNPQKDRKSIVDAKYSLFYNSYH